MASRKCLYLSLLFLTLFRTLCHIFVYRKTKEIMFVVLPKFEVTFSQRKLQFSHHSLIAILQVAKSFQSDICVMTEFCLSFIGPYTYVFGDNFSSNYECNDGESVKRNYYLILDAAYLATLRIAVRIAYLSCNN